MSEFMLDLVSGEPCGHWGESIVAVVWCSKREEWLIVTRDEDVPNWYIGDSGDPVAWDADWMRLPSVLPDDPREGFRVQS